MLPSDRQSVRRRTLVAGAAWAVPAVTVVAQAAPAFASSSPLVCSQDPTLNSFNFPYLYIPRCSNTGDTWDNLHAVVVAGGVVVAAQPFPSDPANTDPSTVVIMPPGVLTFTGLPTSPSYTGYTVFVVNGNPAVGAPVGSFTPINVPFTPTYIHSCDPAGNCAMINLQIDGAGYTTGATCSFASQPGGTFVCE